MMRNRFFFHLGVVVVLLALVTGSILAGVAFAQTGGGYNLTWWTVDGGGGTVTASGYALSGMIGQPDAGAALTGGGYALTGGFWGGSGTGGSAGGGHKLYLPVIMRS